MPNIKEYKIVINNVTETIDAVKALNAQLETLESKIKALESATVKVNVSQAEAAPSNTSNLREEDSLLKQIEQTEQKIAEVRRDEYQELLNQKEILKESKKESASRFAEDNLALKEYSNTMAGLKERLADLKKAMQFKEIGSDGFNKLVAEANEINTKLKEVESSYGQYGRNVGNYANGVAEGISKLKIDVNGVIREFDNAREASRTLGNELKSMAINGEQGTKEFKELQKAVAKLNSDMKDATVSSKAMDELLDTVQSFAAIGSVTQGLSALFGFDDDEIQKSIQKLMALQNVMQGIEKINQQINSQEGIGGWLAKGNSMIDSFVEKITGANKAQEALNKSTTAGVTASKSLATAEKAQAVATNTATVATKALGFALKALGIGLVTAAVAALIEYWDDIYDYFTDTVPELKKLATWFDKIKSVVVGVGTAIVNYMVQPLATLVKVIRAVIQGNFDEIPKIITEGLKKTFDVVGNYQKGYNKETERQQKAHNDKMLKEQKEANEEELKDMEAKFGKSYETTKKYLEKQMELVSKQIANSRKGSKEYDALIKEQKELQRKLWENDRTEREKNAKKNAAANKKALEEEKKQIEAANQAINSLTMRLMDEGLNKKLMQLDEEKRQTLAKLKQNSQAYLEVEKMYEQLRLKEIKNFLQDMEKSIETSANKIKNQKLTLDISGIKEDIKKLESDFEEERLKIAPITQTLVSSTDYSEMLRFFDITNERIEETKKKMKEFEEQRKKVWEMNDGYHSTEFLKELDKYEKDKSKFEEEYSLELNIIKSYALAEQKTLKESFEKRYNDEKDYFLKERKLSDDIFGENWEKLQMYLWDRTEALKEQAKKEKEIEESAAKESYDTQSEELDKKVKQLDDALAAIYKKYNFNLEKMSKADKESYDEMKADRLSLLEQLSDIEANYEEKNEIIKKQYSNRIAEIDKEEKQKMMAESEKYFSTQISNFRDFNSKMSDELSKTPTYDKFGFGVINLSATKKQYKEIEEAAISTINNILAEKKKLDTFSKSGFISKEAYNATLSQLNDVEQSAKESYKTVKDNIKNLGSDFWGSINEWIQAVGQATNTILSSISDITDNYYDAMISKQEEYIEKYSDLLDKQEEKTRQFADAVSEIENELSTARGDRRQQLIDNLNAEMAAQRASLEQEKKIEKQKQIEEDKKKKLEHDQAVAKKKMQEAQAYINMAMAISMAAVNNYPIPAIPMMALAAAVGAAQIAAIKSQNIPSYGTGGVIQGKSHAQGGVKVLGGQAEVEGGEYITNKVTTAKNVELLEYINSKKKRIDINDLIEFYGADSPVKKNFNNVRAKFADGGMIPTLRTDIDINDRLVTAMEDYANRQVVVSVVDIVDRTQSVNNVKVLAGLNE